MPEVETLMVSNHAESINGLLYVVGGGWTDLWRGSPSNMSHFGIAITVLIPEGGRGPHRISIRIVRASDGQDVVLGSGEISMVAREAGEVIDPQRAAIAFNIDFVFPEEGDYVLVADGGGKPKELRFRVHDAPPPNQPQVLGSGPDQIAGAST